MEKILTKILKELERANKLKKLELQMEHDKLMTDGTYEMTEGEHDTFKTKLNQI